MSDIVCIKVNAGALIPFSGNHSDVEFVDKVSGNVVFAFRGGAGSMTVDGAQDAITAFAGGGQTNATPLTAKLNRVSTVASSGDSILLPVSLAGMQLTVCNAGAQSMNVFPNAADNSAAGGKINALSANTAFAVASGKTASFTCFSAGQWETILSA